VDKQLSELCKTCNIYMPGELEKINNYVDKLGLGKVRAAMSRLSTTKPSRKMKMMYSLERLEYMLKVMK